MVVSVDEVNIVNRDNNWTNMGNKEGDCMDLLELTKADISYIVFCAMADDYQIDENIRVTKHTKRELQVVCYPLVDLLPAGTDNIEYHIFEIHRECSILSLTKFSPLPHHINDYEKVSIRDPEEIFSIIIGGEHCE